MQELIFFEEELCQTGMWIKVVVILLLTIHGYTGELFYDKKGVKQYKNIKYKNLR